MENMFRKINKMLISLDGCEMTKEKFIGNLYKEVTVVEIKLVSLRNNILKEKTTI